MAQWIIAVVATLFFLREAQSLLIPIALAILISYALAPVVTWLERHGVPRLAGAALVMFAILVACVSSAYLLRPDVKDLAEAVPQAVEKGREMIRSQLGLEAAVFQGAPGETDGAQKSATGGSFFQRSAGAIASLAGHVVVIFFLIYFLLIAGHHVRNRLVEIAGPDAARRRMVATIVDDINTQIQRYLLVLLVTATIVAAMTWLVLALMEVRNAAAWGVLAGVFNSIPYFGPIIVSGGLFVVGLLQGGGVTQALQMSAAAIVITSLEGWLLTPALMGKAERMSALAVFLGLLLWTWVWGAWGTVLAVPMLVVIKSASDHVPALKPIGRLMAP